MCTKYMILFVLLANCSTKVQAADCNVEENSDMEQFKQQLEQKFLTKSLWSILRILQNNEEVKTQVDKIELTLERMQTQIQTQTQTLRECQKMFYLLDGVDKTLQFETLNRTFYYSATSKVSWHAAHDFCHQRGLEMPMLKDLSALNSVIAQLKGRGFPSNSFWMTASDIGKTPGQFFWADGSPVDQSLWYKAGGFPKEFRAGQETCVYFYTATSFGDRACNALGYYILCEAPEALKSCLA